MSLETISVKSDAELVLEFKAGNEAGFTELVRRHKEKAMQLAYLSIGNYEEAKDISQEAFVKVYHALKKFEMKAKFSTWFYRILMNTVKDYHRKKKWQRFLTFQKDEDQEDFFENVVDRKASPAKESLNQELHEKITRAVEKLPLKQKWIFTLRFMEGLSIEEISKIAGVSKGTVKATIHFAVQKFKKDFSLYLTANGGGL